jgi:hypothetical protein
MGQPGDARRHRLVHHCRQHHRQVGPLGGGQKSPALPAVPHRGAGEPDQVAAADVLTATPAPAADLAQQLDDQVVDPDVAGASRQVDPHEGAVVGDPALDRPDRLFLEQSPFTDEQRAVLVVRDHGRHPRGAVPDRHDPTGRRDERGGRAEVDADRWPSCC